MLKSFITFIFILASVSNLQAQEEVKPEAPKAAPQATSKDPVLARINERVITVKDFNRRYEQNLQLVPGKAPTKGEVLKNIIYFELATQEARRLKMNLDPALREQFDILLYQALVRRNIQPRIDKLDISENEIRKYYDENPLLRTRHIILLTRPGMSDKEVAELKDRASKIHEQAVNKKKSFEELVKQYSEGPSAKTGGDVDWGARHKLLPEYYDAALKLKNVNDISPVVETPYGLHIIQLTGKRPYGEMDAQYKEFIVRTLKETKGQGIYTAFFEDLKKKSKVSVNEELLK